MCWYRRTFCTKTQGLAEVPRARLAHGAPSAVPHPAAVPGLTLPPLLRPSCPLHAVMNCCCSLPRRGHSGRANQYVNQAARAKPAGCLPTAPLVNTERARLLPLPAQAQRVSSQAEVSPGCPALCFSPTSPADGCANNISHGRVNLQSHR